jgi:cytochrome c553
MVLAAAGGTSAPPGPDFEKDIRPILQGRCASCHGPEKQKAGLRVDRRASVLRGGESGRPAVVPGQSAKSDLLRRVTSTNPDERMPPQGDRLTAEEISKLRSWIDSGAGWPDALAGDAPGAGHWAFRPPVRPPVPAAVWPHGGGKNPIDAFVAERLRKEGLLPSPEADRVTLIRRLSLDLLGLPPRVADVDTFLADPSPEAYERLVDQLLASPHYGEKWARHWLDAARYADSDGFEKDKSRQVWFYRDWVIGALNRDLPYDRFIIEQLAGDQLPGATQDQIVATGYLRNSMINEEGGVDPEQFRMEAMFDRMDAIGKGILGLTIQCGQCHDHKFDPLTQEEYYRLFAYLNNDHEANVAVYTPPEQQRRAEIFRQIQEIEADLRHQHPDWRERMRAWEREVIADRPEWTVLRPTVPDESTGGQKYLPMPDGSFLCQGYAPTKHRVKLTTRVGLRGMTAVRLELLTDPNLPLGGPGRSIKGTGALTEFEAEAAPADQPNQVTMLKFVKATADVNPPERPLDPIFDDKSGKKRVTGPVAFALDGKQETAWGIDIGPGRRNVPRQAVFVADRPFGFAQGTILHVYLAQNHGGWNSDDNQNHNLGRLRLAVTTRPDADADTVPPAVRAILAVPPEQRTPEQELAVFSHFRTTVAEWREANEKIEALWKQHPEGSSQLVLKSREQPRPTSVLKRGDFLKPDRPVTAGVPAFLHPLPPGAPPTRLTLARWLVDRRSPTTARSLVNRVWQTYFGTGLVPTPEDFGTQSEPPSHPELLDWLAVEFMDSGWSLKRLHKLIVTSATYRQSSRVSPELLARDPNNRLLARGPRVRVEAEAVRDIALAASGLLNEEVGGRSVFPPLPAFMLVPPVSYGPKVWPEDKGPERYKRGLYVFRYRSLPYPMLQTFDAPPGDAACVRRVRSNTPLQALMTLNEPTFVECARALALRTLREGGSDDVARLTYAFRRCLARRPGPAEEAELLGLLGRQKQRFARPEARPWDLAAADPKAPPPLPEGATPADAAAWTAVARVLLNLDETITKE